MNKQAVSMNRAHVGYVKGRIQGRRVREFDNMAESFHKIDFPLSSTFNSSKL